MLSSVGEFSVKSQFTSPLFTGPINSVKCETVHNRFALGVTESGYFFLYDTVKLDDVWVECLKRKTVLTDCAFLRYDYKAFITSSYDGVVRLHDTDNASTPVTQFDCGYSVHCCDFQANAPVIAAGLDDGHVRLLDLREEVNLVQLDTGEMDPVKALRWSPIDPYLLVVGDNSGRLLAYDTRSPRNILTYRFNWYKRSLDDTAADDDGMEAHDSAIIAMEFKKPGNILCSLDNTGFLRQWDVGRGIANLKQYKVDIFNPRMRKMSICFVDGNIYVPAMNGVLDVMNNKRMTGHIKSVTCVAETGDGFVTGAEDSHMCVWKRVETEDSDVSDWSD